MNDHCKVMLFIYNFIVRVPQFYQEPCFQTKFEKLEWEPLCRFLSIFLWAHLQWIICDSNYSTYMWLELDSIYFPYLEFIPGEPTRKKLTNQILFFPPKCQPTNQYSISKAGQIKANKNVMKYGDSLETSCPKFPTTFSQIEVELWRKVVG